MALSGTYPPPPSAAPWPRLPRSSRDPLKPTHPRDSLKLQQKHQFGYMCHKVRTHGGREPRSPNCPEAPHQPGAPSLPPGPPQPGLSGRWVQKRVPTSSCLRRADPPTSSWLARGTSLAITGWGKASRMSQSYSVSGSTADGTAGLILTPETKSGSITFKLTGG